MKCYIINLEYENKRRSNIKKCISNSKINLDIEWIKAINGNKIEDVECIKNFDLEKYNKHNLWNIKKTEIACTLSHRKCYSLLLESNYNYSLILEDDVEITDWRILINSDLEKIFYKEKPTILLLSGWFWYNKVVKKINNINVCQIIDARLAHSYIINRSAALRILSEKPWYKADHWYYLKNLGIDIFGLSPHIINIEKGIASKSSINTGEPGIYHFTLKKWLLSKKVGIRRKIAKVIGHYELPF